jgi:hypothetical protein
MSENGTNGISNGLKPIETTIPDLLPTDPESFELRILLPKEVRIFRVAGIPRLTLRDDRSWRKVSVARAFPLSDPDHYIGFLDGDGKDIGLMHDPSQLDPESRQIVNEELERRYFVPVVERVLTVKEEFGTVYWTVETDRGKKEIIVRNIRDNLQELSASRVIITDVDGNRFEFPDTSKLDGKSQSVILRSL